MRGLHLFPSSLNVDFSDYSTELYCERLAYQLIHQNPLEWKTMEDVFLYFQQWILTTETCPISLQDNISEDATNRLLLWFNSQSTDDRLYVIGERVFHVSPIRSALLSECIILFKELMFTQVQNHNVSVFVSEEQVLSLLDAIERRFDTALSADPFRPSFSDKLITWTWSSDSVDIRQRPECLATRVELFDFVNLVACAASALQQDNQLLLLLHERVVELQQVDSSQHIRQEREEWAQRERETQTRRVKEVVKRYCEQFGEEDAIAFLVRERWALTLQCLRDVVTMSRVDELTNITYRQVNEELKERNWW